MGVHEVNIRRVILIHGMEDPEKEVLQAETTTQAEIPKRRPSRI